MSASYLLTAALWASYWCILFLLIFSVILWLIQRIIIKSSWFLRLKILADRLDMAQEKHIRGELGLEGDNISLLKMIQISSLAEICKDMIFLRKYLHNVIDQWTDRDGYCEVCSCLISGSHTTSCPINGIEQALHATDRYDFTENNCA